MKTEDILKKQWEAVTELPFDAITKKHLNYALIAMGKCSIEFFQWVEKSNYIKSTPTQKYINPITGSLLTLEDLFSIFNKTH